MHRKPYPLFIKIFLVLVLIGSLLAAANVQAQENEKELFLVANKAFEDGFYDVAIRYITQLLSEYPQTEKLVQANLLLGQCYFFQNQYLKAYDIFEDLLNYPEYRDATLFWLGETNLKGADYVQAEKQYRQLIDVFPESIYAPQAYYSLGWVYFEQTKYEQAQRVFEKLLTTAPTHQLSEDAAFKLGETIFSLQNYDEAIAHFQDYLNRYPKSVRKAEAHFYIAESYYYQEDFLSAVTYYAKTADISLDHKLALMAKVSLGWSYLKIGKYALAKDNFNEALNFSKDKGILSDDVFLGLANLYTEMNDYPEALKAYDELIDHFPNSRRIADSHLGKANILYSLRDYAEAVLAYQTVIDKFKDDLNQQEIVEKAYFGLAWSYLRAGNIDKSIESFEAVKNRADNKTVKISALTQIGDAYQDVEEFSKAIAVYDAILEEFPDSIYSDYVQYRQGVALLKMNRVDAATMSFQSLKTNFPKSKYINDVKYYLAVAYFKKGDWFLAEDHIKEFIRDLSGSSEFREEAYFVLGLSQYNLNDFDTAQKTFQRIIKNFPEQSDLVQKAELNIAKCYYKRGETKEALNRMALIGNKYPQSEAAEDGLIWIADHYLERSDFSSAITHYKKFLSKYPKSEKTGIVHYALGQTYQAQEKYNEAIEEFKKIEDTADMELYAKAKLSIAEIFSREMDSSSAIETYEKIIETSPKFQRDAYMKIAGIHKTNRAFKKALEAYKSALEVNRGVSQAINAEIQFAIADVYELMKKGDSALEEYLKIPYLYSQETQWVVKAYLRMARIFEDKEKWEEAKTIYFKIIDLNTDELKFAQERLEWINQNTLEKNL